MNEYRPAPELVRAHEQLTQALAMEARRAQTATNLRGTDVLQHLLPIIEGVLGFATGVQADLASYSEQLVGESEAEQIVGLDEETFADLDDQLKQALVLLSSLDGAQGAMKIIADVRSALSELVFDEDEEVEDEGDDEALEVEE
jgi:hypothetical protein